MAKRIAIWALAGTIVAAAWGIYFFFPAKFVFPGSDSNLAGWMVVYITIPAAMIARHVQMPITIYQSIMINAATYTLIGLAFELIVRARRSSRLRLHSR